jgi:hypothetical protein
MAVTFHISTHTLFMYTFPTHSTFYELYIRRGVLNNYNIKQSASVKKHVIKSEIIPHYKRFKGMAYFTVYSNVMYVKTEWYCEVHAALEPHTHGRRSGP